MPRGLIVIGSEIIKDQAKVVGLFEGKPFDMNYFLCEDGEERITTVEGDFDDVERLQIVTVWEIQQYS